VVVVSEESGQVSLVERARIVRNLDEPKLARSLANLMHPQTAGSLFRQERETTRRVGPTMRQLARRARFSGPNRRFRLSAKGRGDEPPNDSSGEEKAAP
jgi:hypothetical protein